MIRDSINLPVQVLTANIRTEIKRVEMPFEKMIMLGILAKQNPKYVQVAIEKYGYTMEQLEQLNWKTFLVNSSIPVTIGNMIGGMVFMGALLYLVYKREKKNKTEKRGR